MKIKDEKGILVNVEDVDKIIEYAKRLDSEVSKAQNEWNELVYELSKYKWLYKVACEIIHDMDGVEIDEINKDLERLWGMYNIRKENLKKCQ